MTGGGVWFNTRTTLPSGMHILLGAITGILAQLSFAQCAMFAYPSPASDGLLCRVKKSVTGVLSLTWRIVHVCLVPSVKYFSRHSRCASAGLGVALIVRLGVVLVQ